jgi:predicted DNA-binding transcriptional regulator AlpA
VWLSRQQVLAALGVHRQTLWRLQRYANFPQPVQRGFFEQRAVLQWIAQRKPVRPATLVKQSPKRPCARMSVARTNQRLRDE